MAETYTVKEGDTLSGIAEQYGLTDYSGITGYSSGNPDLIKAGETLSIPVENQIVVGSGAADMEFSQYSSDLQNALGLLTPKNPAAEGGDGTEVTIDNVSQTDPYARMLDELSATSNASTQALIRSIQASRMNNSNQVNTMYDRYKGGLQLLGIQHNSAQSTPDLLMGHIQAAEAERLKKLQDLDREEKVAIMDAEMAQSQNDLETLKAKMDRVEEIKAEKANELKAIYDQMSMEGGIAETQAHLIYDTLNTLDDSEKEIFIQEVAKTYNIPLLALTTALADEAQAREAEANKSSGSGSSKKLTLSQIEDYKDDYPDLADQMSFGMTEQEMADLIEGGDSGAKESLAMTLDLAEDLEKEGIDSTQVMYIQDMLNSGYTMQEIIDTNNFSKDANELLLESVVSEGGGSELK